MKTPSRSMSFRPLGWIAALAIAVTTAAGHAAEKVTEPDIATSFPGLKSMDVEGEAAEFALVSQTVSYDPAHTTVINKVLNPGEEGAPQVKRLISTRLDGANETTYFIDFDPGPSADPSFIVTDEKSGRHIGTLAGDSLVLPGNGFLYAIGRSNQLHLERQKFAIRDGELAEIAQPFSYVGLETKANIPLALTAGKGTGETIANIPKDGPVAVLLRDEEYLLIKTSLGLVGWWKMKTDVTADTAEIQGIYYAGD